MSKNKKNKPLVIGMTLGLLVGIAVVLAISWYLRSSEHPAADDRASTEPITTEVPTEQNGGFFIKEGPALGPETPYLGNLVAYSLWTDADGEHVVILATGDSNASDKVPMVEVLHYRQDSSAYTLVSQRIETMPPLASGTVIGFYRDMLVVDDIDGDGKGEAFALYVIDESPEPGSKRLELIGLYGDKELTISGTTRYDPADNQRIAASMQMNDAMAEAPPLIREEALTLWEDAQFDLAEPQAFPGFYDFRHFDGAVFKGDEPFWNLTLLPQYALFKYAGDTNTSTIRYESIRAEGSGLVIEGTGQVEAWDHGFRIRIDKTPIIAPHGEAFDYTVSIDWSDGTRLQGWGTLAKQDSP
ncbi:MAG: hypothetical protein RBT62_05640 [Spirochaetia bacterium]|jgi:hypothetical protein|nr:hypothetical protein [Spirochaetia bacterium]